MRAAYSRVGVTRDCAQSKTGVLPMGPGGEYRVVGADVRADTVGESDEEPRAQRSRVVTWRQLPSHPLRVNRGEHVEVRRECDDRGSLARPAGVDLDLTIRGRQLPVGGSDEHIQQGHAYIFLPVPARCQQRDRSGEGDTLGERKVCRVVDGVGRAAHVGLPGVRTGLIAAPIAARV